MNHWMEGLNATIAAMSWPPGARPAFDKHRRAGRAPGAA